MAIAIALIVLLLGSVLFHFLSPWNLTPLASNWGSVDDTISISFWVTGIVFAAVNLFMVYAILRYRHKQHRKSRYEPENKKLEAWLTVVTTIGIAALLAPGLMVWGKFVTVPDEAHEFEVLGQQWHWSFRYPGQDGKFGTVHVRLIDDHNPFGIDPEDPAGLDDVLIRGPRVLLPVDRPVKAVLRSKDVIHNFQVAQFRAKMDLVPGQVSYVWLTPTRIGEYEILCAELCGIGHFAMRGMVEVVDQETFRSWLNSQPTWAEASARWPGDPAAGANLYATCATCHGPDGRGNAQLNAPRIAGLDSHYVARQLEKFKQGVRGSDPEDIYGRQMQPMAGMLTTDTAIANIAAYIENLPGENLPGGPAGQTVTGDAKRGARLYRTCSNCHGAQGEGVPAVNAPRLAGMSDWYLVRQLENFKQGIRGAGMQDPYGWQMAEMAKILADDAAIRDVVAYINTLDGRSGERAVAGGPKARNQTANARNPGPSAPVSKSNAAPDPDTTSAAVSEE